MKFYQASSSEMFGTSPPPQDEETPFKPRSPYAISKVFAHLTSVHYREAYGVFASNGILFNHESPRRGETFVTRKVTRAIAAILAHKQKALYLGNLEAKRDWGYAPEYAEAMWKILQLDAPGDFVIGTGESHTVREFVERAFSYAGLSYKDYVKIDPQYFRPTETGDLVADSERAKKAIGWSPRVNFDGLIKIMVDADMRRTGLEPPGEGERIIHRTFDNLWWKAQ